MKKIVTMIVGSVLVLLLAYLIGSGFLKNPSAFIEDYTVLADDGTITLRVGISSSTGYIRKIAVHQQAGGKLYLDCYSAFGGLNGKIGAKDTFTFQLNEDTSIIAIYRNANCYEEALVKCYDGTWQMPS